MLCIATTQDDLLTQLAAVLASGGKAVWADAHTALRTTLPAEVQARISTTGNALADGSIELAAVLHHGSPDELRSVCEQLARRPGPIVAVTAMAPGSAEVPLERLVIERALSVNTAAAGGNASLMTIG